VTQIIVLDHTGDYINTEWFVRSVEALIDVHGDDGIRQRYEQAYGVKLHFDQLHFVTSVEFQTTEQATEFILRWG
jgi:hypothetical protein